MSFEIPKNIEIVTEERRTAFFSVALYGLRGDQFSAVNFIRESVFLDAEGNEIKRVQDAQPFEFSPDTIAQAPDLEAAIMTIHKYLDGADQARMSEGA